MVDTKFATKNGKLVINVPLTSQGKFRCKTRRSSKEYGIGFAPKTTDFTEDAYVEWQIGYDVRVTDVESKPTSLRKWTFVGANGAEKYLYELSEIIWKLCELGMITKEEISDLYDEVQNYSAFLQENFKINMESAGVEFINNKKLAKSVISLPTFTFDDEVENEIYTEISIQKQQYATGVQPMLYVIAPIGAFDNGKEILGNNSSTIPYGVYTVSTKDKACNFLKIMSYFGLCSEKHNHDVLEILKIIRDKAF